MGSGISTVVCHNPEKFCAARFSSSTTSGALCDKSCNSYGRCQDVNYTANGGGSGDGTVPAGDGTDSGDGTVPAGDGTVPAGDGTVPAGDGTDHGDGTVPAGDGMGSGDHAGTDAGELQ